MIAVALALALSPCPALPGAEALWATPRRWIVVGESHGTAEAPAAFGDLVCRAGSRRPVVAAVEQPASDQPLIDAFMTSDGGEAARAALLKADMWTSRDGRSSQAYLALFERLRLMVREGMVRRVVAFQPMWQGPSFDAAAYEAAMAKLLRDASPDAETRVVALVGNVHAMLREVHFGNKAYMPAAALLPRGETLTLNVSGNGGSAWNCTEAGCGAHDLGPQPQSYPRGIVLGGDMPWSGVFHLGTATTASLPVMPN